MMMGRVVVMTVVFRPVVVVKQIIQPSKMNMSRMPVQRTMLYC